MKHYRNVNGPFLIIVPKSTLKNWENEFTKWCPTLRAIVLIGDQETRQKLINEEILTNKFDAIVTSYEMVLKCGSTLKKFLWRYIVIDEAHRIKNEHSKVFPKEKHYSIVFSCLKRFESSSLRTGSF